MVLIDKLPGSTGVEILKTSLLIPVLLQRVAFADTPRQTLSLVFHSALCFSLANSSRINCNSLRRALSDSG
jgi:hypothetical protein